MRNFIVALDGPAGSGKSSISKLVAKRLGFTHIDTGAMYRAVTLEALRRHVNIEDENSYSFLNETSIIYKNNAIYLNGIDVSEEIRSSEVTNNVSTCCKFASVRKLMVKYQRESSKEGKILMDGRDIGTVVLPNADLKIFLTATAEERAKRRCAEIQAKGIPAVYEVVLEEIIARDYKDSHREIAPLRQAEDAIPIDTTQLTMDEVANKIIDLINERLGSMEDFKMEDLNLPKKLRVGDQVVGTVVTVKDKTIYLDVHQFTEGTMHLDCYTKDKTIESFKGLVKVGDEIECQVAKVNEENIYLSRLNQLSKIAFKRVVEAKENEEAIEVVVTKVIPNKGYTVNFEGNSLFMPLSQAPQDVKIKDKLQVRIIEVNEERKNAVVSRRVIEKEEYSNAKAQELESIQVGDVLTGTVAKVEKFGLFIRFKYNQGLLRINQLAHTFTSDINAVAKEGDTMEVKVISKENGKLVLSRKALLDTPYTAYTKTVTVGQTVKGKVVNKMPFGLLIELAPNVKGLLHQSEYSHNPNDNYNAFVIIGDEVECAILALDPEKEKISLSRKALMDNPWSRVTAQLGDVVEVKVTDVLENGLKVETLGVDGFVPASEALTENQNGSVKDYFHVDDTAQAVIIDIKPAEWRLRLSIRKITEKEERKSYEKYLEEEEASVTIGDVLKDALK
ncbi:MAG: (d)CMP kinase [Anaeroplasmataceae bacterium]|nr:(d)CMP kinase [Anaeroplasmataceae bacterium]MDE6415000.1 (d)CMP kinase [Anaeroplasmataceae bacterium]